MSLRTLYQHLAVLLVPLTRLNLRGTVRLLRTTGVIRDALWSGAPKVRARGRMHGYVMELDLADHFDRMTYFFGHYHELDVQVLMEAALQPNDTFVDVGANSGMITLMAARCVGPGGRVFAFEPNPVAMARLRTSVTANGLSWVTPFEVGLSESAAQLTLRIPPGTNDTWATFGNGSFPKGDGEIAKRTASVVRGDDVLLEVVSAPLAVKVDVEGFEEKVINGLEGTIRHFKPLIITEVVAENLARAGSSVDGLFDAMARLGYRPFRINISVLVRSRKFHLRPVRRADGDPPENVVWLLPGSTHWERLQPWLRPS